MKEMNDYLREMEAIVRKDCEKRTFDFNVNMKLYSCAKVKGNIEAVFFVSSNTFNLKLYKVIYFQESNEFRLLVYKLEDMYDVEGVENG